jgi:hypothetical protein
MVGELHGQSLPQKEEVGKKVANVDALGFRRRSATMEHRRNPSTPQWGGGQRRGEGSTGWGY